MRFGLLAVCFLSTEVSACNLPSLKPLSEYHFLLSWGFFSPPPAHIIATWYG